MVYTVVSESSGSTQGLVADKSRLPKHDLTIPRLELVSPYMASNLVDNVRTALTGFPMQGTFCWLDSMVALYWINGCGDQ